jgi:ferredoxin
MSELAFMPRSALQDLLDGLHEDGYRVVGPVVRDGVIQYQEVQQTGDLPQGWTDDQAPASYRLSPVESARCFAWANGPQALKPYLFAPREVLWRARRDEAGVLHFDAETRQPPALAVIGVRACDLAALALQDLHFLGQPADPGYAAQRQRLLLVAVHCAFPADTCFCASTGDGPRAESGFDLALDELDDGYLVQVGSAAGAAVAARLPLQPATAQQRAQAEAAIAEAGQRQFRRLPGRDLQQPLLERLEDPRWDAVAERCLACGNCTSVCPTCFCHAERDAPALGGSETSHLREWDSCFNEGHSQLHGFNIRPATRQRYRQWLTHKLGSWHTQFGRSGCVGCGRCITWCPVGIDLTEEASAICAGAAEGVAP